MERIASKETSKQINEKTTAWAILRYLDFLELSQRGRDTPFSIVKPIMMNGYHLGFWEGVLSRTDFRKKYPTECAEMQNNLIKFVNDGALKRIFHKEPDANNERSYYQVVDEEALKRLAEK